MRQVCYSLLAFLVPSYYLMLPEESRNQASAASANPPKRRIRRLVSSCEQCRTRRVRCNRVDPCDTCVKRQVECCWVAAKPMQKTQAQAKSGPAAKLHNAGMEETLKRLERVAGQLQATIVTRQAYLKPQPPEQLQRFTYADGHLFTGPSRPTNDSIDVSLSPVSSPIHTHSVLSGRMDESDIADKCVSLFPCGESLTALLSFDDQRLYLPVRHRDLLTATDFRQMESAWPVSSRIPRDQV